MPRVRVTKSHCNSVSNNLNNIANRLECDDFIVVTHEARLTIIIPTPENKKTKKNSMYTDIPDEASQEPIHILYMKKKRQSKETETALTMIQNKPSKHASNLQPNYEQTPPRATEPLFFFFLRRQIPV